MFFSFTDAGLIVPDTQSVLEQVQGEFAQISGRDDLIMDSSTLVGRLVEHETALRVDMLQLAANVLNQLNPNYASGVYLDSAMAMVNLVRSNGSYSTVVARVYGVAGTVIPLGTIASTVNNDLFESKGGDYTIGGSGYVDVQFVAQQIGAVRIDVGDLNRMMDYIGGVKSINNLIAGVVGTSRDTDTVARAKRFEAMHSNASSSSDSILSSLLNQSVISGVSSVFIQENNTSASVTQNGITMTPHSLYCCVQGGNSAEIAKVIFNKRSSGSDLIGTTVVPITTLSGLTFNVKFDRPIEVVVMIAITVTLTSNKTVDDVKNMILEKSHIFTKIGRDVNAFEMASYATGVGISVSNCTVNNGVSVSIDANKIPVITKSTIMVTVV